MKQLLCCLLSLLCFTGIAQIKVKPEDAVKHVVDRVRICGKVYGGIYLKNSNGQPTLLHVGAAYPNSPFTVVLVRKVHAMFSTAPEVYYKGLTVRFTGRIALSNDKPQILVNNPRQISGNHSYKVCALN